MHHPLLQRYNPPDTVKHRRHPNKPIMAMINIGERNISKSLGIFVHTYIVVMSNTKSATCPTKINHANVSLKMTVHCGFDTSGGSSGGYVVFETVGVTGMGLMSKIHSGHLSHSHA